MFDRLNALASLGSRPRGAVFLLGSRTFGQQHESNSVPEKCYTQDSVAAAPSDGCRLTITVLVPARWVVVVGQWV